MNTATATATEMQNNFGRYLNLVMSGHEIIVTKNGHEVGRFIPKDAAVSYLTDSLTGILQDNGNLDEIKTESMREKYGFVDLLSRSDFVKESSIIWKLCETEQAKGYISTLTYANMMYIMRKQMTPEQIEDVFRKLKLIFEFADFSSVVLEMAVNMKWKDFEDAIQSATAEYVHADYIITRNIKDFTQSKVMALTPAELLARI